MTYHVVDEATKAQSSGAGFPGRAARLGFVFNESSPRVCTSKQSFPHFFPSPLPTQGLADVRELFCLWGPHPPHILLFSVTYLLQPQHCETSRPCLIHLLFRLQLYSFLFISCSGLIMLLMPWTFIALFTMSAFLPLSRLGALSQWAISSISKHCLGIHGIRHSSKCSVETYELRKV